MPFYITTNGYQMIIIYVDSHMVALTTCPGPNLIGFKHILNCLIVI